MKPFLTNGAKIKLTPDPGWNWEGWDGVLEVSPASNHLKISGSEIIHENDVPLFKLTPGKDYSAIGFSDKKGKIGMTTFSVDVATLSDLIKVKGSSPILETTTGTFNSIVALTSFLTKGVLSPIPDPMINKSGTWKVVDAKQKIAFRNNMDSGKGILDKIQTGLDILGLVPGIGEIADGTNAIIYATKGDYLNAGLSAAAMIPIGGQAATAGKLAMKAETKAYSKATFKALEKQLARDGEKSILKSQSNIQRNLTEHIQKLAEIKKAGGHSSSVKREIKTFQSQLDAINDLLK